MSIDANQLEKLVIDYNKSIRDIGDEKKWYDGWQHDLVELAKKFSSIDGNVVSFNRLHDAIFDLCGKFLYYAGAEVSDIAGQVIDCDTPEDAFDAFERFVDIDTDF